MAARGVWPVLEDLGPIYDLPERADPHRIHEIFDRVSRAPKDALWPILIAETAPEIVETYIQEHDQGWYRLTQNGERWFMSYEIDHGSLYELVYRLTSQEKWPDRPSVELYFECQYRLTQHYLLDKIKARLLGR